jgi:hypothetical protein
MLEGHQVKPDLPEGVVQANARNARSNMSMRTVSDTSMQGVNVRGCRSAYSSTILASWSPPARLPRVRYG